MKPLPLKWTNEITPAQVYALIRSERDIHKALLIFDSASATPSFTHDTSTFSLMLSRLASSHQFRPTERLLRLMSPPPSASTLHPLLLAYGRAHRPLDALRLFRSMRDSFRCEPSERSYVTVLSVLVDGNLLKLAHSFYREMKDANFGQSVAALNVLVKAFCRGERTLEYAEAFEILDRMRLQGFKPDAGMYGKLVGCLCGSRRFREAANYLDEMVLSGVSPNKVTRPVHVRMHNGVVRGLCEENDLNRAYSQYLCMQTRGVAVDAETFSCLVGCLSKAGDLNRAARVVEDMVGEGHTPDEGAWGEIVGAFWRQRKVREEVVQVDWIEGIDDLINVQGEATEAEGDDLEFFISGLLSGRENSGGMLGSLTG
ncbi:Pentatricopeptide repeat-containing protein [Acorus calamus]|uniref:Pentatricopeptide repeat-containing protein n=1 Tax=Acorus calamus TaxID=4465 RepID=A0AAV9FLS9_ACOCL|nr:Pentatricopeptide repeat-containing protein [Acorus calamus]